MAEEKSLITQRSFYDPKIGELKAAGTFIQYGLVSDRTIYQ